jgi:hypothetical protein
MKLKKTVADLEEVPEEYRALYTEDAGEYRLAVSIDGGDEASALKAKVREFRDTNTSLSKRLREMEDQVARFKDVDLDAYRDAMGALEKVQADEERELIKQGKVDELVRRRTEAMQAEYQKQLDALTKARDGLSKEREGLRSQVRDHKLESALRAELNKVGKVRPDLEDLAIVDARQVFDLDEEGNLAPIAGGSPVYGADGEPLTVAEYAKGLAQKRASMFEDSQGGGASPRARVSGGDDRRQEGPVRVLRNPDAETFGVHADDIAAGKVRVEYSE